MKKLLQITALGIAFFLGAFFIAMADDEPCPVCAKRQQLDDEGRVEFCWVR